MLAPAAMPAPWIMPASNGQLWERRLLEGMFLGECRLTFVRMPAHGNTGSYLMVALAGNWENVGSCIMVALASNWENAGFRMMADSWECWLLGYECRV